MKRAFKIVGLIFGVIVIAIVVFAAFIAISPIPSYENNAPEFTVQVTDQRVEEGARIASMLCASCHRSEDRKLGGRHMADASDFGEIHSPNITQHPVHGITDYTDGELAYLLRTGILKDGRYSPPYMPKLPHLSDEDIASIIAFLRSDHPMVQPSDKATVESKPNFVAKLLCRTVMKPLPYPEKPIEAPAPTEALAYGRYVAVAKYDCYQCHSADFKTNNSLNPEESAGFFGGGNPIPDLEGNRILSSNLTMCGKTGMGKYTEDEFVKVLKHGVRPDGSVIRYPMQPYTAMTDEEARAIWEYLQSLPVIENEALMATAE